MAPSNDKEANGAGEQDAEGEDGAVRGARSQVTGSGALLRVPRGLVRPSRQKPSILRAACRQCCLHALGDGRDVWLAQMGKIAARTLRYASMCVRTGVR